MTFDSYTKNEIQYGIAKQTTWGTGLATGFVLLDIEPTVIDPKINMRRPNRAGPPYRHRIYQVSTIHDYKGSAPTVAIRGIAKKDEIDLFLYSVIGGVSEGVTTPYTKTLTFPSTPGALQPDFTASEGCFFTFVKLMPDKTKSQRIIDCICTELTLHCSPDGDDAMIYFEATLMGRGEWESDVDLSSASFQRSGADDSDYYYFHDIKTFSGAGNALDPLGLTMTFKNNAKPTGVEKSSGKFLSYTLGRPYELEFKPTVVWDANSRTTQMATQGTVTHSWILEWGTAGADGHLKFTIQGQPGPAPDADGDTNSIEFTVDAQQAGATAPVTVLLANAIDRTW